MGHASLRQTVWCVAALEHAHDSSRTPCAGPLDKAARQHRDMIRLEGKAAEWVAGERVESRGDEHDVRHEADRRCVDPALQRFNVTLGRESSGHWNIPHVFMQSSVVRGA